MRRLSRVGALFAVVVMVLFVGVPFASASVYFVDSDSDFIDDLVDVCPGVFDPHQQDNDGDGVGDLCDPDAAGPSGVVLLGDASDNALTGGDGDDALYGFAGDDTLTGGPGDDFLDGGPGNNTLTGGPGNDTFAFDPSVVQSLTITDFDDDLDAIVFPPIDDDPSDDPEPVVSFGGDGSLVITFESRATITLAGIPAGATVTFPRSTRVGSNPSLDPATSPSIVPAACVPTAEVLEDGIDQDCDGSDLTVALLVAAATANAAEGCLLQNQIAVSVSPTVGTAGDDCITGTAGGESISGDTGGSLVGSSVGGNDTIYGEGGTDTINGDATGAVADSSTGGDDILFGGDGPDIINGDGANWLHQGSTGGNDTIFGGPGADTINGDVALRITGAGTTGGNDTIFGGDGGDTINGDAGDELLVNALGGNDTIYGGAGADTINGDSHGFFNTSATGGNDTIYGGPDNDVISGDTDVRIYGSASGGNDTIFGGAGADTIFGDAVTTIEAGSRAGDDTITGGADDDTMSGDSGGVNSGTAGNDTFVFDTATDFGDDTITDPGKGVVADGGGADGAEVVGSVDVGVDTLRFDNVAGASIAALDAISTVAVVSSDVKATVFTDAGKVTEVGSILLKGLSGTGAASFADLDATQGLEVVVNSGTP